MINENHDICSYESIPEKVVKDYKREVYDGELLYESYLKSRKGSAWKGGVQRFSQNYMVNIANIQSDLKNGTYQPSTTSCFTLNERGKTRLVHGQNITDRIVGHAYCDNMIMPNLQKYLIYNNGASIKGKGTDFQRKRLLKDLMRYYYENKTNEGYILLIDFSSYYDNILHSKLNEIICKYITNEDTREYFRKMLKTNEEDLSFLDDNSFEKCMSEVFNYVKFNEFKEQNPKLFEDLKGNKMLTKGLNLGQQTSQVGGVAYPIPIDNFIKIVKGVKFYGRYMDDSYIIHRNKEYLQELLLEIIDICSNLGITVNMKKTQICKLSETFTFLKIKYFMTDTGKIVRRINNKRIVRFRQRAKRLSKKIGKKEFENWFSSCYEEMKKYLSCKQKKNLLKLYLELTKER